MKRNRLLLLGIAFLCISGLTLAAVAVDTSTGSQGEGVGEGPGEGDGTVATPIRLGADKILSVWGTHLLVAAILVVAAVAMLLAAGRLTLEMVVGVLLVATVITVILNMFLLFFEPPISEPQPAPNETGGGGTSGVGGETPADDPLQATDLPLGMLGAFGLVALLLVGVIVRYSGTDTDVGVGLGSETTDQQETAGNVEAVGQAAGRAAEMLESDSETVENVVFEAWREMTDALEVDEPRTTTPEEFAAIAVDAGMAAEDVQELTWLFEEVRYGDAEVTDEREQRAQQALRGIQDTYTGRDTDE